VKVFSYEINLLCSISLMEGFTLLSYYCNECKLSSSLLQYNLRVGVIGVIYLVGMSLYTLGSIVVGLLTDKLVSESTHFATRSTILYL